MDSPKQQREMALATGGVVVGLLLGVIAGVVTDIGVGLGIGIGMALGAGLGAAGWLFAGDRAGSDKRS